MTTMQTHGQGTHITAVSFGDLRAGVVVAPFVMKVHTHRGLQHHRGYRAGVNFQGKTERCPHFHQKASGARTCGVAAAKRMLRKEAKS